jgi:hypothetical protein
MKVVELATYPGELKVDPDRIPEAVINAVLALRAEHPGVVNQGVAGQLKEFDRLFEQVYKCRIEYTQPNRIIWDRDRDYTIFLLKWTT